MTEQELIQILVSEFAWSDEAVRMSVRANFCCEYCGRDMLQSIYVFDSWQVDHIVPVSKGGSADFDNLASACKTCNFIKRNWEPPGHEAIPFDRESRLNLARELINQRRAYKEEQFTAMTRVINEFRPAVT